MLFRSQRCCDGLLLKLQIADVLEGDSTVPSVRVCVCVGGGRSDLDSDRPADILCIMFFLVPLPFLLDFSLVLYIMDHKQ